jgi:histidinol dehydrogenase
MSAGITTRLSTCSPGFEQALGNLTRFEAVSDPDLQQRVSGIIGSVRSEGDAALVRLTAELDRRDVRSMDELHLSQARLAQALAAISDEQRVALEAAAARIRRYHEQQLQSSWSYEEVDGTRLGQQVTPLSRVGVYVPGGKAAYPSSVLMNVIPAQVAGVKEIVMVVPAPDGALCDLVLAAAAILGLDEVWTIGGAQAVAALAWGTNAIRCVDKIVGPGNAYVATAKQQVFGRVGIDMIAGPSEILVICDGKTDPAWIVQDLFSQAEHDELAQSILLCPDAAFLDAVEAEMARVLPEMSRKRIIETAMRNRGALIQTRDLGEAVQIANLIAPEHLELSVEDPDALLPAIENAGAIFMGRYTAEALGDYCAGPNHVLPTSGTARFFSPLGVYDFQKRSSLIYCSPEGADRLGRIASVLARGESLEAHARSAECRLGNI